MKTLTTTLTEVKQTMPDIAERVSKVQEYYFAGKLRQIDEMRKQGRKVINLGIGSPDLPPHPEVINTLYNESLKSHQHGYQSYKGHPRLREAAAAWYKKFYGVTFDPEKNVAPLMGSKEGIMHICMTYLNPGDAVLIPDPGYPTYSSGATISGARIIPYQLSRSNNWYPDFEQLETQDLSGVKLMFVNYPHMPTGAQASRDLFQQLVAFAKKHSLLIVHDNPYSFILNDDPVSALGAEDAWDVVIELNSLSKSHNMAGWRIGFLIAAENRISEIMRFKTNMDSGMFLPLQLAAVKALELDLDWYKNLNETYRQRRAVAHRILDALQCTYDSGQAGLFVWARIPASFNSAYEMSDHILEEAEVFLTPGGIFGKQGDAYIRMSLCADEAVLNEALERIQSKIIAAR